MGVLLVAIVFLLIIWMVQQRGGEEATITPRQLFKSTGMRIIGLIFLGAEIAIGVVVFRNYFELPLSWWVRLADAVAVTSFLASGFLLCATLGRWDKLFE